MLVLHSSGYKYLKNFYHSPMGEVLRRYFPAMRCYERFVALRPSVLIPLLCFLLSRRGHRTGSYYIDSISLPMCDNHRIHRHKTLAGPVACGKISMGWCFGFELHLVFNHLNQSVTCKPNPGQVHDTQPVPQLTTDLLGKLFGDKGHIGQKTGAATAAARSGAHDTHAPQYEILAPLPARPGAPQPTQYRSNDYRPH